MPLILGAQSATTTALVVTNSCRFNAADTPKLSITQGTPTNSLKWTISFWFKKVNDTVPATQYFIGAGSGTDTFFIRSASGVDALDIEGLAASGTGGRLVTTQKFRDPSAWYHFVYAYDSANVTAGDRMKMFINGTEVTAFATDTNPTVDQPGVPNTASAPFYIGVNASEDSTLDAYMAEVVLIDGQALTPTSFGEFDSDSPTIWKPIDVSGLTFGDNGFYLDFEDSAALGNDVSGNNNDLTATNLVAADQATDTPVNNFATLNPLLKSLTNPTVLSEGNCKSVLVGSSNADWAGGSTIGLSAGKWYWEIKVPTLGTSLIGITDNPAEVVRSSVQELTYDVAIGYGYKGSDGDKRINETGTQVISSYGDAYDNTDIIGVALNMDDLELKFYKDNVVQNSGTAIDIIASTNSGFYFPAATKVGTATSTFEFNFGGCPAFALTSAESDGNGYGNFEYAPPSGFLAICTKNIGSDGG